MNERIRIISNGNVAGTNVLMPDGTPVPGVVAVEILPIERVGQPVLARLTIRQVCLDVTADRVDVAEQAG